jgi:pentatricopeptide repeat protein
METRAASADPAAEDPAMKRDVAGATSSSASSSGPISIDGTGSAEGESGASPYACKKCARGSSCFPVHIATQKLSTMRRKRNGRGESPDPEDVWCEFENLLADGHRPTVKTYTSLLAALGDMGAPEDAEEVLVRMRDAGEAPDAQAYNAAVHAWCANGKPGEAERVVERMLGDGVRPNASTYPDIVTAYAKMGELRRCESIISRIESVCDEEGAALRWYEKVYHALIRGCCARGHPEEAEDVLKRWNFEQLDMERVAERRGQISRPVTASYGMIIDHYVTVGQMGDARRLLSQMQWDKVAPSIDIFNMLLKGYLAAGNIGAAQDVFRELEGSGTWDMDSLGIKPDVASYTSLMDHWANQGDVDLAEKILAKMELKAVAPDERTFGSLVKAYARGRNPEGAEQVLERMRRYDAPVSTHGSGGKGGRKGGPDWRRKGKKRAESTDTNQSSPKKMKPGVILYSTVVSAYAAVGDMANARRVVAEMSDRKVRPNERTFSHLAWGYGQLGDVAGITQTAQLMADEGVSMRPGGQGRAALVRAVRECGLPASHVDRLLDSLAPSRRQGRRRREDRRGEDDGRFQPVDAGNR